LRSILCGKRGADARALHLENKRMSILLKAGNVQKSYSGVQALKSASFELRAGEVHALVGENGAGKSTFIKILTGAVEADAGMIEIGGKRVTENSPVFAKSLGVAAIYQQPALFPELSVAENIALGQEKTGWFGRVNWSERRARAAQLLAEVGAKISPETAAGELSMPQQQLVEIARALGANARILILDEPTASLSEEDTNNLFRVIRDLKAKGVGMIYISHRLEELPAIADRVTVLRDGNTIDTREMSEVSREELIHLMVGRRLSQVFPKKRVKLGEVVLELINLGYRKAGIKNISLAVRAGDLRARFGGFGRDSASRKTDPDDASAGRDPQQDRVSARRPQKTRRHSGSADQLEHHARVAEDPVGQDRHQFPARKGTGGGIYAPPRRENAFDPRFGLDALGRQSAKSGAQPLAHHASVGSDPG
jgi:ABC-type sugar transport system ATPase subunit